MLFVDCFIEKHTTPHQIVPRRSAAPPPRKDVSSTATMVAAAISAAIYLLRPSLARGEASWRHMDATTGSIEEVERITGCLVPLYGGVVYCQLKREDLWDNESSVHVPCGEGTLCPPQLKLTGRIVQAQISMHVAAKPRF